MSDWPFPKLFAHRGGGTLAPENTVAAMKKGHQLGYQAVEFDVKLSSDGVAILLHDATLGRTTSGSGKVSELSYDQLAREDAGAWQSPQFAGERVPRFTEIAHWLIAHDMRANVEIKPCPGRESETGQLVGNLCRDLWLGHIAQPLVSSFSSEALTAARTAAPALMLGLLVKDFDESQFHILERLGCVSLHCHHGALDTASVERIHARGFRVMTYTVNDVSRAIALFSMGVDGIFTDRLDAMKAAFADFIHT